MKKTEMGNTTTEQCGHCGAYPDPIMAGTGAGCRQCLDVEQEEPESTVDIDRLLARRSIMQASLDRAEDSGTARYYTQRVQQLTEQIEAEERELFDRLA